MNDRKPVSAGAFFATAFAGCTVSAASLSPHLFNAGRYPEAWFAVGISFLLTSLLALPALALAKTGGLMTTARLRFGRWAAVYGVIYAAALTYYSYYCLSLFLIFIENTLAPSAPVWLIAVCLALTAWYGAKQGLAALTRAGIFCFAVVAAGFLLIFALLCRQVNLSALLVHDDFAPDLPTLLLFAAGRTVSVVHLLLFAPQLSNRRGTGFFASNVGFHLLCAAVVFFLVTCLGDFADEQLFPTYTLAVLAELGAVQRLDIVFLVVWIVGVVARMSLNLLATCSLLRTRDHRLVGGKKSVSPAVFSAAQAVLVALPAAVTAQSYPLQQWLLKDQTFTVLAALTAVLLPLVLWGVQRLHEGKEARRA